MVGPNVKERLNELHVALGKISIFPEAIDQNLSFIYHKTCME